LADEPAIGKHRDAVGKLLGEGLSWVTMMMVIPSEF
jgi:hypothetical protein